MILTVTMNAAVDRRYVVDRLTPGEVLRVKECRYSAGGKGINVSRIAAIMGAPVTATGLIGGHAGDYIREELEGLGIRTDFVHTAGETRTCVNVYDASAKTQTEFLEPGFEITPEVLDCFFEKFANLLPHSDAVTISGSVPQGVDSDCYARLVALVKERGKPILLDASGELLQKGIIARPDFIKPNKDEIQALLGAEIKSVSDAVGAAVALRDGGIGTVAVSLGKDGVVVACAEGVYRGITPDVPVINTVGCGDSMVAAFAVGFVSAEPPEEIIRRAVAVSTANAMREETGFFVPDDAEKIYAQVQVVRL